MDYLFFALLFGLIIGLAWKTLLNETKISLSYISNNAIIDDNKAQDIVSAMYGASQAGRKSAKFTISYPSQDAYIANIQYIKRKIKSIFSDDIKVDVEALEYKGIVEATITTSWE